MGSVSTLTNFSDNKNLVLMPSIHPTPRGCPQTILIVDDDDSILALLAEGFKMFGLRILTANNGPDGFALFKKERIKTVLTDIRMPGEYDGAALACRIRIRSPYTIIAVMTGEDGGAGGDLLKKGIADYFFTKPFSLGNICKTLVEKPPPA
jgi:DNA-binding NtrC family response regulator